MKKIFYKLCIVLMLGLFTGNLSAQGFYATINAGYGCSLSGQNSDIVNASGVIYPYVFYADNIYYPGYNFYQSYDATQVYLSLGKGVSLGGSLGYMLNKYVGAELSINYLLGAKTTGTGHMTYTGGAYGYITTESLSAKMLQIKPALVFTTGMDKINPYIKFGVVANSGTITHSTNYTGDSSYSYQEQKLNGGIGLGFSASLGATYKLNKKFSLYAELQTNNLSFAPTKGEIIKNTYNGVDQLPSMTVSSIKTDYVDHYTLINGSNNSEPGKALKVKYPMGNVVLNIGLKINL